MQTPNVSHFDPILKKNPIITGGHFLLRPDGSATLNEGTVESFRYACAAFDRARSIGASPSLGILVNNMGGACSSKEKACPVASETSDSFALPTEYLDALRSFQIDPGVVRVYWEKQMRNAGKKLLHKLVKADAPNIKKKDGAFVFVGGDGRSIALTRANRNDEYGMAACPLIMCAYFERLEKDGFPTSLSFYYVGANNGENIPNYFAIEKGEAVAAAFLPQVVAVNAYLLDDLSLMTRFDVSNV